jgi:hypothetical protein
MMCRLPDVPVAVGNGFAESDPAAAQQRQSLASQEDGRLVAGFHIGTVGAHVGEYELATTDYKTME